MKEITCEQYSPEWWAARRSVPTASEMGRILTPKKMEVGAGAMSYLYELVADTFDPEYPRVKYESAAMRRGKELEPQTRDFYELTTGEKVRQVGFCTTDDGRFGCSPDALVGEDGILEAKNYGIASHVEYLLTSNGVLPYEFRGQCHGLLIVTERKWVDWLSHCPGFPPLIIRVVPDDYTKALALALNGFHKKLTEMIERIKELMV